MILRVEGRYFRLWSLFLCFYLEKQKSFIPKKNIFLAVVNIKTKKLCLLTQFSGRFCGTYLEILQGSPIPFSLCKSCPFLQSCRNFQFRYHRGCLHHLCDLTRIILRKLIFEIFIAKVFFFLQCSKMQLITFQKFHIQTCFIQFLWFFSLKCWFKGQMMSRIHLSLPNAYKLMCFDRNINGNRDVKFLECD